MLYVWSSCRPLTPKYEICPLQDRDTRRYFLFHRQGIDSEAEMTDELVWRHVAPANAKFAFPLVMNHSSSQRDMHSSTFGTPGMSTSTGGSNPNLWSHSTSSNTYGSLSDSLNQSLSQARPQYQAGYLMVSARLYGAQSSRN